MIMETNKKFEINPKIIAEGLKTSHPEKWDLFLNDLWFYYKSMEKGISKEMIHDEPDKYLQGINRVFNEGELFFNELFVYRIMQLDLMEIDNFLEYHLDNSFDGAVKKFARFLVIIMRQFDVVFTNHKNLTIQEWIDDKITATSEINVKYRQKFPRKPGDGYTDLNVDKIALLANYLRQSRFILSEDYVNNKDAGEALSILTGYSNVHLRQKLGEAELKQLLTRKNLDELHNFILRLLKRIKDDLSGNKTN